MTKIDVPRYKCDLCGAEGVKEIAFLGVGIRPDGIVFSEVAEAERHLCWDCERIIVKRAKDL